MFTRKNGAGPIAVVEDPFALRLERLREEYFIGQYITTSTPTAMKPVGRRMVNIFVMDCSLLARLEGCNAAGATDTLDRTGGSNYPAAAPAAIWHESQFRYLTDNTTQCRYQLEKKAANISFSRPPVDVANWLKAQ